MLSDALVDELRGLVGAEQVHAGPAALIAYSLDGTFAQQPPDVALTPATTDEVAAIMRFAAREGLCVLPRGAGTSLAGGAIPIGGGILLSLARMNSIIEIDTANAVAVVQPGVVTAALQREVERIGLFYPPDPASLNQSTLGGNVACNAGGPRCLKYGVTKDYVLGTDSRAGRWQGALDPEARLVKNVTGYQLTQLFVGSEGTLGTITEIILRLVPLPRFRSTAAAYFDTLDNASRAVAAVIAAGILPATLEMMDNTTINVVEDYLAMGLPRTAEAMLILEQDGNDAAASARQRSSAWPRSAGRTARSASKWLPTRRPRDGLWRARRAVSGALGPCAAEQARRGHRRALPRSAVPEMVRRIGAIAEEAALPIAVFGHAGDGNLHPNILFDRRNPGELERVEQAAAAIFRAAISLGGTLSGEHGIGSMKREFLEEDLGETAVEMMRRIKQIFDPKGLLSSAQSISRRADARRAQTSYVRCRRSTDSHPAEHSRRS